MMKRIFAGFAIVIMSLSLASCGFFGGSDKPSELTIKGTAFKNANGGLPTTVRFYALSSDHLFYGYDYFSLTLQDQDVLGVTLKGTLDEQYIEPGSEATFGPYDLPRNTRIVGAVGTFKDIGNAKWRDTVEVKDRGEKLKIYVVVSKKGLNLMTESEFKAAEKEAEAAALAQLQAQQAKATGKEGEAPAAPITGGRESLIDLGF